VTPMESETGNRADGAAEDGEGESDSERRRRRRRRKRRKGKQASVETLQLLLVARWAVGFLAMLATWAYGIYVYNTTPLGWGALIFFPAGIAAMVCISYALAIPFFAFIGIIVGLLSRIDSGLLIGIQRGAMAFVAVGAVHAVWRLFVFLLTKREVTRNEAGYK
jgi:hypothetical protein